ncbi:molecular chaperone DnaK (HSP70) [Saccharopolyspora erythraea NRRL 2338]|uniref:Heat shock protein HSP70 n=2 Tax=Saccharopolyspora erythraea TaxID=1836 RepID=A4FEB4_SACEN|nr:Hsp70 family protein [Saccharopolyspora erythraea]EQD81862.1 molecular chaperone Hsp70 [Saccharopolyspora erythraea D]PFG96116.1 molecular chaperone DnaK (HSP70) [Saccharopolyspora erythraea NRRL 2338]QRK92655.1 Hsp70 family protein [Saccharopolyspora erythraea]CAM02389.1 heat shock protein HSP70 [Saccharopolyspora erythraea NRRL 2338]
MPDESLKVFGIDLGTTYSAIAYVDETGRPAVCRNTDSLETTPSVVFFENESNVVVGSVAKNSAITYPDQVVSLIKREMGSEAVYDYHGTTYTPESISALILKQLAQDAATHTGGPATRAVITVPAYFGMLERTATKNAGQIAGLDVIGIVPEPVAAALHYEATTDAEDRTILVYDLGGGTFDTTAIRVSSDEIEVLCTDGDDHLGGADWDARLRDYLLQRFTESTGTDAEDDEEFMQSLATTAEETKKQLSRAESRPVALRGAGSSARVEVTRELFEHETRDLLDKTIDIVRRTLETLRDKRPGTTIDDVLLVGGSTKMPAVAERLRAEFGWEPKLHDPDLAVAKGAALYALGRVVHKEKQDAEDAGGTAEQVRERVAEAVGGVAAQTGISVRTLEGLAAKQTRNVLPKAFGVKLVDTSEPDWQSKPKRHYVHHLVHANDALPTEVRNLQAATVEEGQQGVEIELFEQSGVVAGPELAENKALNEGKGLIDGLPPMPVGSPVDIRMTVDAEGLLELNATEPSTGKSLDIKVRVSVRSDEEVAEAAKVVAGITVSS